MDGEALAGLSDDGLTRVRRDKIGFVFQFFNLLPTLTAAENVAVPLLINGETRRQAISRAQEVLAQVGLGERTQAAPAQLSGGQQQRVAIARALVGKPKVLLADEPTGNLDSKNAQMVMDLLAALHKQGSTIVMVTHDAGFAEQAQRQISLFDGKVVDDRRTRKTTAIA